MTLDAQSSSTTQNPPDAQSLPHEDASADVCQLPLWPQDRIAAIDIGSNSIRLVVAQVEASGSYRVLDEERENTRLAASIDMTGRLDDEAIAQSLVVLRHFLQIVEGYKVTEQRAIATAAVRDASNGAEFIKRVREQLGLSIEIIPPQEEGRLAFLSVAKAFDVTDRRIAIADIGGGSTEIVLASCGLIDEVYATQLGAVRIAERCELYDAVTSDKLDKASDYIDQHLKKHLGKAPFVPATLFGTGGTFTAMASLLNARKGAEDERPLRGYVVNRAEVRHLMLDLASMSIEERRKLSGLNPKRADIIVAGLLVIERILRRLKVNTVQVHTRGVRDGLLLTMIQRTSPRVTTREERRAAAERLARSCGVDLPHARQVGRLARMLLDQLAEPLGLDSGDGELVEIAALLANVGYLINFEKHHKHSYHLILNSELIGFDRRELLLLALLARYHRGAPPKKKHQGYRDLSAEDQKRIAPLASLLRLALALDRTHRQQVEEVRCQVVGDRVEITVRATGDAEVDLWAARRKVDLFERTFGKSVYLAASTEGLAVPPNLDASATDS